MVLLRYHGVVRVDWLVADANLSMLLGEGWNTLDGWGTTRDRQRILW